MSAVDVLFLMSTAAMASVIFLDPPKDTRWIAMAVWLLLVAMLITLRFEV